MYKYNDDFFIKKLIFKVHNNPLNFYVLYYNKSRMSSTAAEHSNLCSTLFQPIGIFRSIFTFIPASSANISSPASVINNTPLANTIDTLKTIDSNMEISRAIIADQQKLLEQDEKNRIIIINRLQSLIDDYNIVYPDANLNIDLPISLLERIYTNHLEGMRIREAIMTQSIAPQMSESIIDTELTMDLVSEISSPASDISDTCRMA
jgi:hypothetical protein